ncbi:hypothetical protein EST38_g613 [Candolleomyces aberdarensis]|uniref:MARVEL domain-containing protein n=1 Tax=Candolleomyces aberdarensis TaxID=2316362 RepID=A0A4Q2DX66_9AGAR|nr:hypothetical protein EST38_g613 [Candolleomyces aberdarensis]
MPSLFNTIRASIYGTVLVFTIICLAMAGHFQSVLAASDLTRFVPFAIFVCSASLFIFMVLILFSVFLRERNPISTRIELASLGLAGVFWLVLGVYLTTSESQDADVECFASADSQVVLDPEIASIQTDQFQAMYRVLMSFALMNAALIIASCLILLFLAVRRHRNGDVHMWHGPVTSGAWFNTYNYKTGGGAAPAKPQRRQTSDTVKSLLPTTVVPVTQYTEKPERKASRSGPSRHASQRSQNAGGVSRHASQRTQNAGEPPRRQNSGSRQQSRDQTNPYMQQYYNAPLPTVPRQARHSPSSPTGGNLSSHDFDAGGMVNPARAAGRR